MTRSRILAASLTPIVLALAGCDDEPAPPPAPVDTGDGSAQGDVLEGSISDAMLPIDSVISTPPLASEVEAGANDEDDRDDEASSPDETASDDESSD